MGMFDDVHCEHPELVCSEGHLLTDFQTKDLGQSLDRWTIFEGRLNGPGYVEGPFTGTLHMCEFCEKCPCFVVPNRNIIQLLVWFELEIKNDTVQKMTRVSESTAHWLLTEPSEKYMNDCLGPMSFEAAMKYRSSSKP